MKQNKTISLGKRGMNTDSHISQLEQTEYTHLMNGNTENETGELIIQNEPSNYLTTDFGDYKVIGYKKDLLTERVYFFLTNTETKKSSIGYVSSIVDETLNDDVFENCSECNGRNILGTALEDIVQVETNPYIDLINDECHSIGEGFNFDINYPIKHIEIKQEKLGTYLYFTDGLNPQRWINVSDTSYLFTQEVPCEEDIVLDCFQPNKLLQSPHHTRIKLEADALQVGGTLRLGTYEFYAAYCDLQGNEITQYSTPINPISLFDENNSILEQTQLDAFTNYAIRIKAENLDTNFQYYKIVVVERVNVNGTPSSFVEGIHPTTDDTILYTSNGSVTDLTTSTGNSSIKTRFDQNALLLTKPFYETAKGLTIAGNRQFQWGLKVREEINLQPVVNLFGSLLRWQTSIAKEDLYKSAIATSKFKGFMREEIQPFGIRFLYKDGDYSAIFPLVGRPAIGDETDEVDTETDKNYLSVLDNAPNCTTTERNKKWQYYNTAIQEDVCPSGDTDTIEVVETIERSCIIENVLGVSPIVKPAIPANTLVLNLDDGETFTDLPTYIEDHQDETIPGITSYLEVDYTDESCEVNVSDFCTTPTLVSTENTIGKIASSIEVGSTLVEGVEYVIITLDLGDDFTGTGYTAEGEYFIATGVQPTTWVTTDVQQVGLENNIYNERPLGDYGRNVIPKFCNMYSRNETSGEFEPNVDFMNNFMPCLNATNRETVFKRDYSASNETCNSATSVINNNDVSQPSAGIFLNYYGDANVNNLLPSAKKGFVLDYEETITFDSAVTLGSTSTITINGVDYLATWSGTGASTASDFNTTHGANITTSTGGTVSVVGNSVKIINAVNGYTSNVVVTTGDMVVYISAFGFTDKLHKGALFFKIDKAGRDKAIFEITKSTECVTTDYIPEGTEMRYSIFSGCGATTPLAGGIHDVTVGTFVEIDFTLFSGSSVYVAIDAPIRNESIVSGSCSCLGSPPCAYKVAARTTPPCGCFSVYTRDIEFETVTISWDSISINKKETYESACTFFVPKLDECDPKPYANGSFAYWESTEEYPDNEELFDSSTLKIKPEDLENLDALDLTKFEEYFTNTGAIDIDGNYELVPSTNLRCSKIRHFKFPSNIVAPFMSELGNSPFAETAIFPLGFSIHEGVVQTMLQVARNNNLITQKELDNIEGFEILKGDNSVHRSVIANGLGYDMYKYNKGGKDYLYSNYPHNDLGKDILHYKDSSRKELIPHPFDGEKNNKYTFISPDLFLSRNTIPTEVLLSGYQLGSSTGIFADVEDHPKWTILGEKARQLATRLAIAEVALETVLQVSEMGSNISAWFTAGTSSGTSAIGTALQYVYIGLAVSALATNAFVNAGRYRFEWLKTFRDLGVSYNFANYYVSHGVHNTFLVNPTDTEYLRGISTKRNLKSGRYKIVDEKTGEKISVNNYNREWCAYLSLGAHFLEYPTEYIENDNNTVAPESASKAIMSQNGCQKDIDTERKVGSPYFTLQNYIPDQYGKIDSIKWLTTNNIFKLGDTTECTTLFGGNVCISRFTWKRKIPIFTSTAMGTANKTPFDYYGYRNVGYPRFFCDYEVDSEEGLKSVIFPDIKSDFTFDCETGRGGMYVKPPSKFYLYNYGITDFLVESEINCNFRYGKTQPKDQFFPLVGDMVDWTQEKNVSIKEPELFYYNNIYSYNVNPSAGTNRILSERYNKEEYKKLAKQDNSIIYSEVDRNESSKVDPFLIFKPLNRYDAATKYGKLISVKGMASDQLLGRFENQQVVFNAVDVLADRLTPTQQLFGSAGLFQTRPVDFVITDLGYGGTQHTDMVSTPYGHFSVDAKRGKIFQLNETGLKLEPISDFINGKPSGMRNWFREHLPFKILKYFPSFDTDNKFKDIGISMGYDARFERVFFTKKDYIPKVQNLSLIDNRFYAPVGEELVEVELTDNNYFQDVSWTIAYKASEGSWVSYYSFKPTYYVNHQNFFQTGQNTLNSLWTHHLNNTSFQVFYGNREEFTVEFPIANQGAQKMLNNISLNIETKRWLDKWDSVVNKDIGFNKMTIWNNTNNSGVLNLIEQKSLSDTKNYPKTNSNNTQDILYTSYEGKHNINYFYNRVKNQDNGVPQWLWDKNRIGKSINPNAVSFRGKAVLERLTGQEFLVQLTNDKESRYSIILKNSINTDTVTD